MPRTREALILATLMIATTFVAALAVATHRATWVAGISFVTGAACVWLTVKESVWNFPVSLANVAAFLFVFAKAKLYADAGLQVVYFILTIIGWYLWLHGGENRRALHVSRVPKFEAIVVSICAAFITCGLTLYLRRVEDAAPFWDALTTAISLAAQWLLNRKYLENWWCWIVVDVIYIPLYAYKSLYLTSVLYGVFLCMAVMGLLAWRETWWRRRVNPMIGEPRGFEVVVPS
jgi:nicotinamide mononucleotide transporter